MLFAAVGSLGLRGGVCVEGGGGREEVLETNQHRPSPHLVLVSHPHAGSGRTQRSSYGDYRCMKTDKTINTCNK